MKIILIGNYPPDGQESMERFSAMLAVGFSNAGHGVELWRPQSLFGDMASSTLNGFGKWLGYVDKWILFPMRLRCLVLLDRNRLFHVCDHSNAPYLAHLPKDRSSITCHDVLAIRGARGHVDAFCQASRFGKILQAWILNNLSNAQRLAADSEMTMRQLKELAHVNSPMDDWQVIPIAFNGDFAPMPAVEIHRWLNAVGMGSGIPYLLHVGSGLPRKNRALLLKMVVELGSLWTGRICFAGQPMDPELRAEAERLGVLERVVEVVKPDHTTLLALYSGCAAFIFPSYSEGFGWPLIEAQACGAPVIASNVEPMPEVSGGTALHRAPDDAAGFAAAFLELQDATTRATLIARGFENCKRYAPEPMIEAYLKLMGL